MVPPTAREAMAQEDRLLSAIPPEAVGAYLSYNYGYDFSALPERFTLEEIHQNIIATNASPVGFIRDLALELGAATEISRDTFFKHGVRYASSYEQTFAGSPAQMADLLEEMFEATGSRGGFMLGHVVSTPADLTAIVHLLVPELQRRRRVRTAYTGRTLRETLGET